MGKYSDTGCYDAVMIGAGPAGLAAAITLKRTAPEARVLLLEKMGLATDSAIEESLSTMLKPAAFSLQYIWINMMAGCFVGLVTAAFVKKEKSIFED